MQDPWCHTSSILVERRAEVAFDIMADGIRQGKWAWGSFDRKEASPGVFVGTSVFSGKQTYVRLNVDHARLQVEYDVGATAASMQPRNISRVIPGAQLKLGDDVSVITLMSWRLATQTDADWTQFCCIHEAEMYLIKGLLERDA